MENLKPCPFCGGRAHMITRVQAGVPSGDDGYTTVIKCLNHAECGAVICRWALKKKWSVESAIKAWNRRANDSIIQNAPTVDAVQVVRCGECKYHWKNGGDCVPEADFFCADGERRTE